MHGRVSLSTFFPWLAKTEHGPALCSCPDRELPLLHDLEALSSQHGLRQSKCWQASLDVATAGVPSSGVLQVALQGVTAAQAPYEAVAAQDRFMLTAKDWVGDPGRQLQYEFRFQQVRCGSGAHGDAC